MVVDMPLHFNLRFASAIQYISYILGGCSVQVFHVSFSMLGRDSFRVHRAVSLPLLKWLFPVIGWVP